MNGQLNIRKASPQDAEILFGLICALADYEKLLHEVRTTVTKLKEALNPEKSFIEVLIAEFNNRPVGYALFFKNFSTFLGKPGIYLEDLFVKPEYRGKGIGKELLETIIRLAKENGYGRVEWSVLDWNEPAIEFYKKRGAFPLNDWTIFRLSEDNF